MSSRNPWEEDPPELGRIALDRLNDALDDVSTLMEELNHAAERLALSPAPDPTRAVKLIRAIAGMAAQRHERHLP